MANESVKAAEVFDVPTEREEIKVISVRDIIKQTEDELLKLQPYESYKESSKRAIQEEHRDVVEDIEYALNSGNTAIIKETLSKYIGEKVFDEEELAEDDFKREIAMEVIKAVSSVISDCISNPEDLERLKEAFQHNPVEAENLIMDSLNKALGNEAEKKILQTIEGVFYGTIIANAVANPDWLVQKGFCSDADTAKAVSDSLVSGDFSSIYNMDELFLSTLKSNLEKIGISLNGSEETIQEESTAANLQQHIPDTNEGGVIDLTPFGGNKLHIDGAKTFAQPNQQIAQAIPQTIPQTIPHPQNVGIPGGIMKIQPQIVKSAPDGLKLNSEASVSVQQQLPSVQPGFIQTEQKDGVKDTPVSIHNPQNDEIISQFPWLADIEKISNDLGQAIKFIHISKPNMKEPSGLIQAIVYTNNGLLCEPKSFTIDAAGVMYDKRPKFFPILNPVGYSFEDYPAYLLFSGGKENKFIPDTIRNYLIGGKDALPKHSAYRAEWYQLNKVVDLSSIPTNMMSSDMRKRVQNRLANGLTIGLFGAAMQHDPASRWAFKSFNRKDESFVLTNEGVPYRFNLPCYARKKLEIHFTSNNEAKIIVE